MMCGGFIGSGLFQQELDLTLAPGDSVQLGRWTVTLEGMGTAAKYNWTAVEATFRAQNGASSVIMKAQKRNYGKRSQPITEAAIHTTWREDLYIVLGDPVNENLWNFRIYRNPLVSWLWWGAALMVLGVAFAMMQGRRSSPSLSPSPDGVHP
jgi:cytochrome c-type biogenesis protein CcmF